jgi:hypothetical protein
MRCQNLIILPPPEDFLYGPLFRLRALSLDSLFRIILSSTLMDIPLSNFVPGPSYLDMLILKLLVKRDYEHSRRNPKHFETGLRQN